MLTDIGKNVLKIPHLKPIAGFDPLQPLPHVLDRFLECFHKQQPRPASDHYVLLVDQVKLKPTATTVVYRIRLYVQHTVGSQWHMPLKGSVSASKSPLPDLGTTIAFTYCRSSEGFWRAPRESHADKHCIAINQPVLSGWVSFHTSALPTLTILPTVKIPHYWRFEELIDRLDQDLRLKQFNEVLRQYFDPESVWPMTDTQAALFLHLLEVAQVE